MKITMLVLGWMLCFAAFAAESTDLGPQAGLVPQTKQSFVNTKDCTAPIRSSPYVIVAGNGGANMHLTCPADRPVMYGWQQQVGFAGVLSVQAGGGASWIVCCPVGHKWSPSAVS